MATILDHADRKQHERFWADDGDRPTLTFGKAIDMGDVSITGPLCEYMDL